jgi:CRP-like cAMP-binding protein
VNADDLLKRFGDALAGPTGALEVPDGEWIVREGDTDDRLFIVLDGLAVVLKDSATVVDVIGAGGVFGELSFIDGRPRSASVRAQGALRVMSVSRAEFERAAETHPSQAVEMMSLLLGVLSARVRESTDAMVALAETGRQLAAARTVDDIAAVVMARVTRAVPTATAGIVAEMSPDGGHPIVGFGLPATLVVPLPLRADSVFASTLARHPEGLVVGPGDDAAGELGCLGHRWALVCGLFHEGAVLGFAAVLSNAPQRPFTPAHQTALAIVANQAAAAMAARR